MNYYVKIGYSKALILITVFNLIMVFSAFSQELKILTYNIRFDNPADGVHAWNNRKENMMRFLNSERPDIMGFQEVLLNQLDYLRSGLINYNYFGVGREDGKHKGEFSPVFFDKEKYNLDSCFTLWLSETPGKPSKGWDAVLERIATFVILKIKDRNNTILVVNTHYDHVGNKARTESSNLIRKRINELNFDQVILMGDLNSEPSTEAARIFMNDEFSDSASCNDISGPSITFSGFEATDYNNGPRIDYIFLKRVKCLSYEVKTPVTPYGNLSDHLPVIVIAEL